MDDQQRRLLPQNRGSLLALAVAALSTSVPLAANAQGNLRLDGILRLQGPARNISGPRARQLVCADGGVCRSSPAFRKRGYTGIPGRRPDAR